MKALAGGTLTLSSLATINTGVVVSNIPTAVFSQPPVGVVGLTEHDARRAFGKVDVYLTRFRPMRSARYPLPLAGYNRCMA